jgi:hypothetical protein
MKYQSPGHFAIAVGLWRGSTSWWGVGVGGRRSRAKLILLLSGSRVTAKGLGIRHASEEATSSNQAPLPIAHSAIAPSASTPASLQVALLQSLGSPVSPRGTLGSPAPHRLLPRLIKSECCGPGNWAALKKDRMAQGRHHTPAGMGVSSITGHIPGMPGPREGWAAICLHLCPLWL